MDLIPTLSAIIIIAVIATIALAVFYYAAFKLRERRVPARDASKTRKFFKRFTLEN